MSDATRDQNHVPSALGTSSTNSALTLPFLVDPITGRLLTDTAAAGGTVTSVSVVSANGFAGTVATATTTPAITLTTTITGIIQGDGTAISAASTTGTGAVVLATAPTFQTSINGAYLTASQILGTDASSNIVSLPVATYPSLTELSYVKGVTSAIQTQLNAKGAGTVTAVSVATANGVSGSSSGGATPALTITLGAITPTTVNGNTFTTGSSTYTGTAAATYTFPGASATIAGLGTTQTFTGQDKFNNIIDVNNAVTVTSNAGTVPVTFRLNTFTNSSAATMAITMATASAVDGQMTIVRVYDFSAVAQTIGWTNTENSTVTAPTTSNGSTTLPLTVGFMYNTQTSKWRCIASA